MLLSKLDWFPSTIKPFGKNWALMDFQCALESYVTDYVIAPLLRFTEDFTGQEISKSVKKVANGFVEA